MARSIRAPLAILALLVGVGPAVAQFGTLFGEPPPRPPSSVPMRQRPPVQPLPPPDDADPADMPLPPPPGRAAPGAMAPARPNQPGFESQPLAPPPGGVADPGRPPAAPLPQPASLPPGAARETLATPGQPPAPPPEEAITELPSQKVPNPTATFSGLDKITGRITTFDVAINETVQFGALRVRPRACYTRLPTEAPNTTGFIEVDEVTLQGEVKRLFRGWMFASSPGLHGVEHSIYDVWLADCKGAQTAAVEEPAPAVQPQPAAKPPAAPRASAPRQSAAPPPQQQRRQPQSPGVAPAQRAPAQRLPQY